MSDNKKEKIIQVSIENTKKILSQMENCICKINSKNGDIEIGYLCKIPFPNNNNDLLPVLITNNNILNENDKIIYLNFNNEIKKIKIDKSRKKYINNDNNILIIEIKPNKDKIYNYLELDENEIYKENKEYKSIYIIHFYNEEIGVSYNIMNEMIDNKEICNPILSLKEFKIIGIYNYKNKNNNIKYLII